MANVRLAGRLVSVTLLLLATRVNGDDAWFLRMNASGAFIDSRACTQYFWSDDVVFFNAGVGDAHVTFLDATYPLGVTSLTIPAGRSTTLHEAFGSTDGPAPEARLGVLHADVPHEVLLTSRMLLSSQLAFPLPEGCPIPLPPFTGPSALSTAMLPVRRSVVPAGQRQVHLAADLGGLESRISVVIYNVSDVAASATIELRRGCDDSIIESRQIDVPPRTAAQLLGLTTSDDHICPRGGVVGLRRTVVVTSTQPSLTWVTATQQFASGAPILGASIVY